ncbi:hypothetical protein [Alicycliphilus denitrificans]|uniref:hypothetical protein n=1 Tax=Alicycliphilus denitrificans TaxID=179636 RepID=UPI00384E777B
MTNQFFDEGAWRVVCQQCADRAIAGTGLSETLFAQNLYREIHEQLQLHNIASAHHVRALEIAQECGYLSATDLHADAQWNADHGYCTHGIELNHCPVGCESDGDYH